MVGWVRKQEHNLFLCLTKTSPLMGVLHVAYIMWIYVNFKKWQFHMSLSPPPPPKQKCNMSNFRNAHVALSIFGVKSHPDTLYLLPSGSEQHEVLLFGSIQEGIL